MISMTMTKRDPDAQVTNRTLGEAVDAIMKGMDRIIQETKDSFKKERKFNLETFATKEDLKSEVSWLRDDIKGLEGELSNTVSRKEYNKLNAKVDKYIVA